MTNNLSIKNVIDSIIPISRFDKGEYNKIFDEVRVSGYKVVVNNDVPACVLLTPEKYQEMVEMIEDQYLLALAEERLKNDNGVRYSAEEVYKELEIESDDFDEIPMEYGVDFE